MLTLFLIALIWPIVVLILITWVTATAGKYTSNKNFRIEVAQRRALRKEKKRTIAAGRAAEYAAELHDLWKRQRAAEAKHEEIARGD